VSHLQSQPIAKMKIKFFTTGGTIDKVYFDSKSEFEVGSPTVLDVLKDANVAFESECESILRKDSLDISDSDRQLIRDRVIAEPNTKIIITHGTDTMPRTAEFLLGIPEKTIVLTGSMQPARFRLSDATFNIGAAVSAVQILPAGVYIVMNGRVFHPPQVRKNRELNRFEDIQ
jgi:L-asparaginase